MSKKLLLISATQQEVLPYLQHAPHHDVLITGVGIPMATYKIARQLLHHHYDVVVQAGIAGAFAHSYAQPGAVVQVQKEAFGDLGAWENNQLKDLAEMGLSTEPTWIQPHTIDTGLPKATAITVQTVTDHPGLLEALSQKWQADVESMEGAAAAMICRDRKLAFVQIRAISNMVGNRDKASWQIDTAIHNLNNALYSIIPNLLQ